MAKKRVLFIVLIILVILPIAAYNIYWAIPREAVVDFYINDSLISENEYAVHKIAWKGKEMPPLKNSGTVGENSLFYKDFDPEDNVIIVKKGDVIRIKTNKHKYAGISVDLVKLEPRKTKYESDFGYEAYIYNYSLANPEAKLDVDFEKLHWLDEDKMRKEVENFPEVKKISKYEYEISIDTSEYDDAYKQQLIGYKFAVHLGDLSRSAYVVGENDYIIDYYFVFDIEE